MLLKQSTIDKYLSKTKLNLVTYKFSLMFIPSSVTSLPLVLLDFEKHVNPLITHSTLEIVYQAKLIITVTQYYPFLLSYSAMG